MSAFPVTGALSIVAPAMRAAAGLLEASGITGLSVTCGSEISIQVTDPFGDAAERARVVTVLAGLLGSRAFQDDDPARPASWVKATGVLSGVPVTAWTRIEVLTAGPGQAALIAVAPGGDRTIVQPGTRLGAGWRWATELDTPAGQQEVA
jgi:hypothetical protein